jgi:hypothetical protein
MRSAGQLATARAGAGVALELGEYRRGARQFEELMPEVFGIGCGGLGGQRRGARLAAVGDKGQGVINALPRQADAAVSGVSGLAAASPSGGFLDNGGRRLGRVSRGRDGRVAGVTSPTRLPFGDARRQLLDAPLQPGEDLVALGTSGAARLTHGVGVAARPVAGHSPSSVHLNGYPIDSVRI